MVLGFNKTDGMINQNKNTIYQIYLLNKHIKQTTQTQDLPIPPRLYQDLQMLLLNASCSARVK